MVTFGVLQGSPLNPLPPPDSRVKAIAQQRLEPGSSPLSIKTEGGSRDGGKLIKGGD